VPGGKLPDADTQDAEHSDDLEQVAQRENIALSRVAASSARTLPKLCVAKRSTLACSRPFESA
jgi:hypothetical protein